MNWFMTRVNVQAVNIRLRNKFSHDSGINDLRVTVICGSRSRLWCRVQGRVTRLKTRIVLTELIKLFVNFRPTYSFGAVTYGIGFSPGFFFWHRTR